MELLEFMTTAEALSSMRRGELIASRIRDTTPREQPLRFPHAILTLYTRAGMNAAINKALALATAPVSRNEAATWISGLAKARKIESAAKS
jgi:hypothetical protein